MENSVVICRVPDKVLFSHREAARFVGQSPRTFFKTVKTRGIPVYWEGNRKVYKLNDLEEYISSLRKYNCTCESPDGRRKRECKKMAG